MKNDIEKLKKKIEALEKRVAHLEENGGTIEQEGSADELVLIPKIYKEIQKYDLIAASLIQRRYSMGYCRAARIIQKMKEKGQLKFSGKQGLYTVIKK